MGTLSHPLRTSSCRLPLAPFGMLSDQALARRVGAGDQRAFEALYRRFKDPLYRYCMALVRQPQDAEEALQAAMVNAYRALRGRRVGAHLRACAGCRAYRTRLEERPKLMSALVPAALPALAGTRILNAALGSLGGAGHGGAIAGAGVGTAAAAAGGAKAG